MVVNREKSIGNEQASQASQLDNTILTRAAGRARGGANAFVRPADSLARLRRPQPEPTLAKKSGAGCGTGPRPPRLTSSKRRRKPRIVAHSFGVVWRVESSVGDVLGVVTEGIEFAEGANDVLGVVHLNDAVVVLIADQGVTVPQTHGARGRWAGASRQVAAGTVTGEVLPHDVLVLIDLDDTVVIRVRDQRVAVLQPAGKSDTTHRFAVVRVTAAVLPDNIAAKWELGRDLESAVVVFVADENVAVLQKLCAIRVVEPLPATPNCPYCQTMFPPRSTNITRS